MNSLLTLLVIIVLAFIFNRNDFQPSLIKTMGSAHNNKLIKLSAQRTQKINQLFAFIPADTNYLMASITPIPTDSLSFHLQQIQKIIKVISQTYDLTETKLYKLTDNKTIPANAQQHYFLTTLINQIKDNLSAKNALKVGLKVNAIAALYEYEGESIFRYEIDNANKLIQMIHYFEKKTNYPISWKQCNQQPCLMSEPNKTGLIIAVILLDKQLVITSFKQSNKNKILHHITNKATIKTPYTLELWTQFLIENDFKGYLDGFRKLPKHDKLAILKQRLLAYKNNTLPIDNTSCDRLIAKHLNYLTRISFGIRQLEEKNITLEMAFEVSPIILKKLKALVNLKKHFQQTRNGMIEVGVNTNLRHLRQLSEWYVDFLQQSLNDDECITIKPTFLIQIKRILQGLKIILGTESPENLFISANKIDFKSDGSTVKNIEGYIALGSQNPLHLANKLIRYQPYLAGVTIKDDNRIVYIPQKNLHHLPIKKIGLSVGDKRINLFIGDYQATSSPILPDRELLFWLRVNSQYQPHYLNQLIYVEKEKNQIHNTTLQGVGIDHRGILLNYKIQYH